VANRPRSNGHVCTHISALLTWGVFRKIVSIGIRLGSCNPPHLCYISSPIGTGNRTMPCRSGALVGVSVCYLIATIIGDLSCFRLPVQCASSASTCQAPPPPLHPCVDAMMTSVFESSEPQGLLQCRGRRIVCQWGVPRPASDATIRPCGMEWHHVCPWCATVFGHTLVVLFLVSSFSAGPCFFSFFFFVIEISQ
jgi:hypothetical protein